MKIALMSPYDFAVPGGVNSHVTHLAEQFVQKDHEVHVLAPCSQPLETVNGNPVVTLGRSLPVPAGGSIAHLSFSVWKDREIKSHFRTEDFDVVHVHEPFMPFLSWLVVWRSPTVTVGTFHAFNERARRLLLWKPLLRYTARRLDGRIAVSNAALKYVSRHYPGDYEIIPNGVDVDHFSAPRSRRPEFDDGRLNILFVGRAEKRKGLTNLIGAYSRLKWEFPDLRLIVVGPDNPDGDAARAMAERGIDDIVFVGRVTDEELPTYHHSADIFCSAAIGRESFGIVLLEAMAAGLPLVATGIEGHASIVTDGKQGLLFPPRDEEALAGALRRLITDAGLRKKLGSAGSAMVEDYRWDRVADRVLDFYEEVSSSAGQHAPSAG